MMIQNFFLKRFFLVYSLPCMTKKAIFILLVLYLQSSMYYIYVTLYSFSYNISIITTTTNHDLLKYQMTTWRHCFSLKSVQYEKRGFEFVLPCLEKWKIIILNDILFISARSRWGRQLHGLWERKHHPLRRPWNDINWPCHYVCRTWW